MIRILVADDHTVVREGVKRILHDTPDLRVTGEAWEGQMVLKKVASQAFDMVLLDLSMPDRNGLEVLQDLSDSNPELPVLVFSMHEEHQYAVRAFKAGAAGYLTKDCLADELVIAVRRLLRRGRYVSPSLAEYLAWELTHASDEPLHAALSNREYQVLCRLGSGKTVTEMVKELYLSVKTVSTYIARIKEKLHLRSTAELIHYAIRHHLVD